MTIEKNPFPDNSFFENEAGIPQGGSWNGEVDGMPATYGAINPGAEVTYAIDSREVIFVESGEVTISFQGAGGETIRGVHKTGALFELPVGQDFTLSVTGADQLVYSCLYPDTPVV